MTETGALAQLSRARQYLAQAKDLSDIKAVRDMAEAARQYARAAKLGEEAVAEAAEIKVRAERMAGEALKARPMNRGAATPQRDTPSVSRTPTLADDGISPNQSKQWQDEAALPAPAFEKMAAASREQGKPLTSKAVAKAGREHKLAEQHAEMNRSRAAPMGRGEASSPINRQNLADARLKAAFSKAVASVSEIVVLSPERVLEVLSIQDAARTEERLAQLGQWLERFRVARSESSPRVMGGERG